MSPGLSMRKLWMVVPPTLMAATPVGARTAHGRSHRPRNSRRTVDFPVPASPVRNTFRPDIIASSAACCSSLS